MESSASYRLGRHMRWGLMAIIVFIVAMPAPSRVLLLWLGFGHGIGQAIAGVFGSPAKLLSIVTAMCVRLVLSGFVIYKFFNVVREVRFLESGDILVKAVLGKWRFLPGDLEELEGIRSKGGPVKLIAGGKKLVLYPAMDRFGELLDRLQKANPSMKVGGY